MTTGKSGVFLQVKISTRGRYGLKAIVDIAYNSALLEQPRDCCVSLKSVAERQGISENYLEQIIAPLKKARLVHSCAVRAAAIIWQSPPKTSPSAKFCASWKARLHQQTVF
jgi:hypothetical protein